MTATSGPVPSRIIPAYAGSTRPLSRTGTGRPDHPRIRGEHAGLTEEGRSFHGSSPHTRGARFGSAGLVADAGIIPAYAGSTKPIAAVEHSRTDHPRIRGEHVFSMRIEVRLRGSSPHTRGAQASEHLRQHVRGIIPAYAGSTWLRCGIRAAYRDHPRIRGEHDISILSSQALNGSSPHTRGARGGGTRGRQNPRIIPAYAGSTRHAVL